MLYCSYHEFSFKEELLEAKPPSIEGSVVAEHANVMHFQAHIWMTQIEIWSAMHSSVKGLSTI